MPSDAYEVKGLLTACVREDNPTVFIINKRKLGDACHVPEELFEIPLGKGHIVREGSDATVVAIGRMVEEAKKAADGGYTGTFIKLDVDGKTFGNPSYKKYYKGMI